MKIQVFFPKHPFVKIFVESYQYVMIERPVTLTALPNGYLDGYIIVEGGFHYYDWQKNHFELAPQAALFSLSHQTMTVHTQPYFVCLNIKFHPSIFGLRNFGGLNCGERTVLFEEIFGRTQTDNLFNISLDCRNACEMVQNVDDFFYRQFFHSDYNNWLQTLLLQMGNLESDITTLKDLAQGIHTTPKTLSRRFKSYTGLSVMQYYNLLRWHRAVKAILRKTVDNNALYGSISTSLTEEYYDQSHFHKECKKIAGLSPRNLLPKMQFGVTDILLETGNFGNFGRAPSLLGCTP